MRCVLRMPSWPALCLLTLGACASTEPAPTAPALPPIRADTIARLSVDGPNAFINGNRVQGGSYVFDGDTVSTGPGTSAMVLLNQGGYIQLDENTDPLVKQGACLLLKILHGRVVFNNLNCLQFEDNLNMAGVAHSVVHIMSSEQASRVTVLDGRVEMRSPREATLKRFGEYVATRDGAVEVLQLTEEAATARIAWTQRYFRQAATTRSGGISPAEAGAIGALIGIFFEIIQGDRSHRERQEPHPEARRQSQPLPQPQAPPPSQPQPQPQLPAPSQPQVEPAAGTVPNIR